MSATADLSRRCSVSCVRVEWEWEGWHTSDVHRCVNGTLAESTGPGSDQKPEAPEPFPWAGPWGSDVGTLSPSFPIPLPSRPRGRSSLPLASRPRECGEDCTWSVGSWVVCVCMCGSEIVPCPNPTPNFHPFPAALPPAWHYETGRSPPRHHGYHCLVTGGRRSTGQI